MSERELDAIPNRHTRVTALRDWVDDIASGQFAESQLEGQFVSRVVCEVLGFESVPSAHGTVWAKPPGSATGLSGTPDAVLGDFSDQTSPQFRAAFEFKTPGTDLDKPQARAGKKTPVEQAFEYGVGLFGAVWVLVSDMRVIRLYAVDEPLAFWEFDLVEAARDDDEFERLWWLLSATQLLGEDDDSPTADLVSRSIVGRKVFREGFYEAYFAIRSDLLEAIREAVETQGITASRSELLTATQRLLDRLLFVFYCEDHPQRLIPHGTFERVIASAASLPGTSTTRIYGAIKDLFHEIDIGSPPTSGIQVSAYNGELFKHHPIIDVIDLPDDLQQRRQTVRVGTAGIRTIKGIWGLNIFDYWTELGEHMLGSIFEESLSDLVEMASGQPVDIAEKLEERKRHGIYYTTDVLADYIAAETVAELVSQRSKESAEVDGGDADEPDRRLNALLSLRIADLTCGSGAFLVSTYREELKSFWREQEALRSDSDSSPDIDMFAAAQNATQATLLRDTLYGIDLLPQAVEIAKLALWLRSARRGERVSDLSHNIVAADAVDLPSALGLLNLAPGSLDLVVGNPPWGAEIDEQSYQRACSWLGVPPDPRWDSWELFVLLGLHVLKPGGRLAFVLPDSLLYPEKKRLRKYLVENTKIVRLQQLGAGWFGPNVRMDTMILEVKKEQPGFTHEIRALLLSGQLRRRVIDGRTPLTQVERQRGRTVPQERSTDANDFAFEIFRGQRDDHILSTIHSHSSALGELCDRGRGEEMSKSGLYWTCPSCLNPTTPGKKAKGGGYHNKHCPTCGNTITAATATLGHVIEKGLSVVGWDPWIDGDDVSRRFVRITPQKRINSSLSSWRYKDETLYKSEKILIRQAGVGIVATLDGTGARCPQSVYVYRLKPEIMAKGYRHEFVLGALLSRTMAYVVFKAFGEVDPDKAHAKMTHARLQNLPIPTVDFSSSAQRKLHDDCVRCVKDLLDGPETLGGPADLALEQHLRSLWGLTGADGAYINGEFADLPLSQPVRELFPDGVPVVPAALLAPAATPPS